MAAARKLGKPRRPLPIPAVVQPNAVYATLKTDFVLATPCLFRLSFLLIGAIAALVAATGTLRGAASAASFTILVYYAIANLAALRMSRRSKLYGDAVPILGLTACIVLAASLYCFGDFHRDSDSHRWIYCPVPGGACDHPGLMAFSVRLAIVGNA